MKRLGTALAFLLATGVAFAQQPPPSPDKDMPSDAGKQAA